MRDLEANRARFGQVTGRTRLRFRASFAYVLDTPFLCAQPFGFRYSVKADDGERPSARDYLLIVTPEAASEAMPRATACRPCACEPRIRSKPGRTQKREPSCWTTRARAV